MNYTHYDYLELAPGAAPARIEAAYMALLERFQYGTTEAGQDLSGLVRMIHAAYAVLSDPLDAAALTGFTRVQQVPETLAAAMPELAA